MISETTVRDIFDQLELVEFHWDGSLSEVDFMKRILPIDKLPSNDSRYKNMEADLIQHRDRNKFVRVPRGCVISVTIGGSLKAYYNSIIMQRKLIKVGTSAAIIIPKTVLDELGLKIGDTVHVEISKKPFPPTQFVDPEIIRWTDEFMKKYRPLFEKYSKS